MMTSGQVAQQIGQQQQMFYGQSMYAQQIGINPPGQQFGVAPQGMGLGMAPPQQMPMPQQMPGVMGITPTPPSFNYSGSGSILGAGYSSGDRFASNVTSGIGGAAQLGIGTAGLGLAAKGLAVGSLGMAALPALPLAAGAVAVGAGMRGAQQQSAINAQLGQFQFFNQSARTGMGFTRQDATAIGQQLSSLAHVPDLLTSVQELTNIIPKLKSSGVMQGVKDAAEFQRRFKEAITTRRDTAKIVGTTLDEAAEFFDHSRRMGFFGRSDHLKQTLNRQIAGGMTGMSQNQVMAAESFGADMAQSIGARRHLGAEAATKTVTMLGAAQRQGIISEQQLTQMTGLTGSDAVQATAERLMQANMQLSGTAAGRAAIFGLIEGSGKDIRINQERAEQLIRGEIGVGDLKKHAASLTREQKMGAMSRFGSLSMDFQRQGGTLAMASMTRQMLVDQYGEAGAHRFLTMQGIDEQTADLMMDLQGVDPGADKNSMVRIMARERSIRQRSPDAIMKRMKTRATGATTEKIAGAFRKFYNDLGSSWEGVIDDVVGRAIIEMSEEGAKALSDAFSGGSKSEFERMLSQPLEQVLGQGKARTGGLRGFGNTETWAWMARHDGNTGRSIWAEQRRQEKRFGATGSGLESVLGEMGSEGFFMKDDRIQRNVGEAIMRHAPKNQDLFEMSNARRMDVIEKAVAQDIGKSLHFRSREGPGTPGVPNVYGEINVYKALMDPKTSNEELREFARALRKTGKAEDEARADHLEGTADRREQLGSDVSPAAALVASGLSRDSDLAISFSDLNIDSQRSLDVQELSRRKKANDQSVHKILKEDASAVLKSPKLSRALGLALESDTGELGKAVANHDIKGIVEAAKRQGINITSEEAKQVHSAYSRAKRSNKGDELRRLLGVNDTLKAGIDITVASRQFEDFATNLRDSVEAAFGEKGGPAKEALSALADAVQNFGMTIKDRTGSERDIFERNTAALDTVQEQLGNVRGLLAGASAEEKKQLIAASGGERGVVGTMYRTLSQSRRLGGEVNEKSIREAFGVSESEAKDLLSEIGGAGKLTSENKKRLEDMVATRRMMGQIQGDKGDDGGTSDEELLKVLNNLNESINKLNTNLEGQGLSGVIRQGADNAKNVYSAAREGVKNVLSSSE
jgi:hypothetical protein